MGYHFVSRVDDFLREWCMAKSMSRGISMRNTMLSASRVPAMIHANALLCYRLLLLLLIILLIAVFCVFVGVV